MPPTRGSRSTRHLTRKGDVSTSFKSIFHNSPEPGMPPGSVACSDCSVATFLLPWCSVVTSCTSVVDSVVDVVVSSEVDSVVDVVPAVMSESSVIIFPIENGHGTMPPKFFKSVDNFPSFI